MVSNKTLLAVCTFLLLFVFMYTGLSKLLAPGLFRVSLAGQPFPSPVKTIIIYLLPASEILVSVFMLSERTKLFALYAAFILMLSFTIYTLLIVLNVFNHVPCSCGGIIRQLSWSAHLVLNILLTVAASIALIIQKRINTQTS